MKSKDEKPHLDARDESQENARPESNCRAESKLVTLSEEEIRHLLLVLRPARSHLTASIGPLAEDDVAADVRGQVPSTLRER